jgi:hypothetical protein
MIYCFNQQCTINITSVSLFNLNCYMFRHSYDYLYTVHTVRFISAAFGTFGTFERSSNPWTCLASTPKTDCNRRWSWSCKDDASRRFGGQTEGRTCNIDLPFTLSVYTTVLSPNNNGQRWQCNKMCRKYFSRFCLISQLISNWMLCTAGCSI